jgi:hypothetical protein
MDFDDISLVENGYKSDLPKLIPMNRNVMWFPTSVLNTKAAFNQKNIVVNWESTDKVTKQTHKHKFEFAPMRNNPMPIPEHSKLFDILLALYANNKFLGENNEKDIGTLYFRMSDVADIAGKQYTAGFRMSLAEAIYRYMRCVAFWTNAYLKNGERVNLACTLIEETSIWDNKSGADDYNDRQRLKCISPGRSLDKTTWSFVKFNRSIAEELHTGDTRLFLSEIIKSELRPIPYVIYRYFYAFSDKDYIKRDLNTLCSTFGYSGKPYLFPDWFREQIDEIAKMNLIEDYVWPKDISDWSKAQVSVKCKSFVKTNSSNRISKIELDISSMTNMMLLELFTEMKTRNLLSKDTLGTLNIVEKTAGQTIFYATLRNILETHAYLLTSSPPKI